MINSFCIQCDKSESSNGLQFFGRFDSVDQMNLHQKLYDFTGDDDCEDRR